MAEQATETAPATPIEELQASIQTEIEGLQAKAAADSENAVNATPGEAPAITTEADAATATEGDAPPTPEPDAEETAEGAEPEPSDDIDPVLLAAAKRAQRSPKEIEAIVALGPETARMVLAGYKTIEDNYSSELSRAGKAELERRTKEQEAATDTAKPELAVTPTASDATKTAADSLSDYGIDEDLLDPAVAAPIKKLVGDMAALRTQTDSAMQYIEEQKKAEEEPTGEDNKAQAAALMDDFLDPLVSKHEVYADAFGTGKTVDVFQDKQSAQAKARFKLLTEANAIFVGATQKGRDMTADEALERALSILWQDELPKKATEKAREKVASQLDGRAKQFTPKPTNRAGGRVQTPMQAARQTEREKSQELGIRK